MTSTLRKLACICLALSLFFASVLETSVFRHAKAQQNAPQPTSLKVANKNVGGAFELTFDTLLYGDVKVYLPDDMAAGDTISGTVVAEPKGKTAEERAQNQDKLEGYVIDLGGQKVSASKESFTLNIPASGEPGSARNVFEAGIKDGSAGTANAKTTIPLLPNESKGTRPTNISPADFVLPPLGQQGRPVEIFGPFDGNSSDTTLVFVHGKGGGASSDFNIIAESPRKAVFRTPRDADGPGEISLKEGSTGATGQVPQRRCPFERSKDKS